MADRLPQSVEELLAAHKVMVAAMSPKQRTAYYDQITADQLAQARATPYKGGERQAQAMMPKGIALVADADTLLLPARSVVQNCTIDLRGAGYFCVDLDGENSTGLYREGNKVMGYGEFVYLDGLHILGPTAVFEIKTRAERAEAERDAALAEADSWKNCAVHQNGVANTALEANDRLTARVVGLETDKIGLGDQIGKLLSILDGWDKERADEFNGGLTMHTYGQSPDWYVEAAFWSCFGFSPSDARAALSKEPTP